MSSFVPRAIPPTLAEPDPTKHVKYTLGMVLGVDDFTQEFAYLAGRDRWLARDLLGYGTASGLRVGVELENGAPQVVVTPGVAVSPRGQLIRVAPAQCADLNLWLATRHEELRQRLGNVPSNKALLRLYLVLSYRDCATDMVPIPGEPCRSQEETLAPSRLADDFKLELRYAPPDQREEDALRDFVEWLGQVEITEEPGSFATLEELEKAIRDAATAPSSPPSPPDFFYGSPPEALRIHPSMAYEYLRAAFRLWTTELRPKWHVTRGDRGEVLLDAATTAEDDGVLLAEVSVPLARQTANTIWQVEQPPNVEVHEERRPYLIHLRMLQELVVSNRRTGAGGASSSAASIAPGFSVVQQTSYGLPPDTGRRFDYARADHTHGTPPAPVLAGDVTGAAGATTVVALRNRQIDSAVPTNGQLLGYDSSVNRWKPVPPPASTPNLTGDVTSAAGATTVVALRNRQIDSTAPTNGQLLGYDSSVNRWRPVSPPATQNVPTNFVSHPDKLPNYSIVAAGVLRGDGSSDGSLSYNNLQLMKARDGSITVLFDGYQQPSESNPTHQYIVKVLPVLLRPGVLSNLSVVLGGFGPNAEGFSLIVNNAGESVSSQELTFLSFMIEVSRYDLRTIITSKAKDAKEKEDKAKDAKESEEKATKEKDTKETKDTKDTKEKDTKETKDTKDTKEKDTKEKDKTKDTEKATKDTDTSTFMPAGASPAFSSAEPEASDNAAAPDGRAFIVEEERPEVGRKAFDLADKQDDKLPEAGTSGKQAETFN